MNERELFDACKARPSKDDVLSVLRASQRTVYNLCYQVLRDAQDAEDASQKVLLRVLEALPRISDGEHYRRMLCRISFQVALTTMESRKTRRAHEMEKAQEAGPDPHAEPAAWAPHRGKLLSVQMLRRPTAVEDSERDPVPVQAKVLLEVSKDRALLATPSSRQARVPLKPFLGVHAP